MGHDSSRHAVLETSGDHVKRLMRLFHTVHQSDLDFKIKLRCHFTEISSVMLCPQKNYL